MHKNINHFKVVGISHHLASVERREQFNLSDTDIQIIHAHLGKYSRGGFVLSTCNRTEIYFVAKDSSSLITSWAELVQVDTDLLKKYLYQYEGQEAIDYLFRVGSGLDSQILGDFQIIGQIKSAYQRAVKEGSANNKITRMIDVLLKTSKRIKNETALSSGVASMAYSAIQHVQQVLSDLSQKKALVYGAGKMGSAVVRKLAEIMPQEQIVVANRTPERAEALASRYDVHSETEQPIAKLVDQADFIISTAAVDEPLFTKEILENIPLSGKCFVDLSMPRSIDKSLGDLAGVELLNLDELQDLQNETFEVRKSSIPKAEQIVAEELNDFYRWIKEHDIRPTIHAIKEKLNTIKDVEVKKLQKEEPEISQEQIDRIAEAIINKVTTQCVKHVKKHNGNSIDLIHELFELKQSKE